MSKVSIEVAITKTYVVDGLQRNEVWDLSLIHISEPTRPY